MRPGFLAASTPALDGDADIGQARELALVQAFVPEPAAESFCVLCDARHPAGVTLFPQQVLHDQEIERVVGDDPF